jgi:hypothetical protein
VLVRDDLDDLVQRAHLAPAERKVWRAVDALNIIMEARTNILNCEHELSAIRARIDTIERDAISREELKPWIRDSS